MCHLYFSFLHLCIFSFFASVLPLREQAVQISPELSSLKLFSQDMHHGEMPFTICWVLSQNSDITC